MVNVDKLLPTPDFFFIAFLWAIILAIILLPVLTLEDEESAFCTLGTDKSLVSTCVKFFFLVASSAAKSICFLAGAEEVDDIFGGADFGGGRSGVGQLYH